MGRKVGSLYAFFARRILFVALIGDSLVTDFDVDAVDMSPPSEDYYVTLNVNHDVRRILLLFTFLLVSYQPRFPILFLFVAVLEHRLRSVTFSKRIGAWL